LVIQDINPSPLSPSPQSQALPLETLEQTTIPVDQEINNRNPNEPVDIAGVQYGVNGDPTYVIIEDQQTRVEKGVDKTKTARKRQRTENAPNDADDNNLNRQFSALSIETPQFEDILQVVGLLIVWVKTGSIIPAAQQRILAIVLKYGGTKIPLFDDPTRVLFFLLNSFTGDTLSVYKHCIWACVLQRGNDFYLQDIQKKMESNLNFPSLSPMIDIYKRADIILPWLINWLRKFPLYVDK